MLDLVTIFATGGIFTVGYACGRLTRRPKPSAPDVPMCSCEHGFGSHKEPDGCGADIKRSRWNRYGDHAGYEWVPCPCRTYDGPEPLPRVWTGGLTP